MGGKARDLSCGGGIGGGQGFLAGIGKLVGDPAPIFGVGVPLEESSPLQPVGQCGHAGAAYGQSSGHCGSGSISIRQEQQKAIL